MTTTTIEIEAQSHRVGTNIRNDAECFLCGRGKPYDAGYAIRLVSATSWTRYDSATNAMIVSAGEITLAPVDADAVADMIENGAPTVGSVCAKRIGREYKIKWSRLRTG